ncbi:hypothetical protein BVI434_750005 [Burkholderia vietnamiensis]|nr:hypothetical protein BVI434_750005 [Burkholderia vietnamiensis]
MRQVRVELHVGLAAHRRSVDRHRAGACAAGADHRRPRHGQRAKLVLEQRRADLGEHDRRSRRERHPRHRAGAARLRRDLRDVDVADLQQLLRVPERQCELHGRARADVATGREPGPSLRDRQQRRDRADADRVEQRAGQRDGPADVRDRHAEQQRARRIDAADVDERRRRRCDLPRQQRDRVLRHRLERVLLQRCGADDVLDQHAVLLPVVDGHLFGDADRQERRERWRVDAGGECGCAVRGAVDVRLQRHRRPVRSERLARPRHAALLRQDHLLRDGQDGQRRRAALRRVLNARGWR